MKNKILYFVLGALSCFLINLITGESYKDSHNFSDDESAYIFMSRLSENNINFSCETDQLNRLWITPHNNDSNELNFDGLNLNKGVNKGVSTL